MVGYMRGILLSFALLAGPAMADGPPQFFKDSLPGNSMGKILESYGALQGEGSALDPKTRELIALAVGAQIPCPYCIYAPRNNAIAFGATEEELREAAATAGYVRLLSAVFQGAEYDLESFKKEHDALREASK